MACVRHPLHVSNSQHKLCHMNDSDNQINQILDRSQIRQLPLMTWGIGLLFISYAIAQQFILKEPGYPIMFWFAIFCAFSLFSLYFVYNRMASPETVANQLMGIIAILVLASTLLRLFATREPKQSANLILFMVAAGVVFVSTRWFLVLLGLTLGGWGIYAVFVTPRLEAVPDYEFWGLVLLSSAVTAYILHLTRARVVLRSVRGEILERAQKEEIEHRAMQLETSAGVGQQITSVLDPEKLLNQITSLIQRNYQIRYVGVFLPQNGLIPAKITPVAEAGRWIKTEQTPNESSWHSQLERVYQNGMMTGIDESRPTDGGSTEQTTLLLPLTMGSRRLGVLALQSNSKTLMRPSDEQVFHLLANQVSVALENSHLYDQIIRMNQELEMKVEERTRELQDAYAQLERLDKTKSDFITIASHELKTPLTLINLYNQMFSGDDLILENETYRKWANQIDKGATRLNLIVERMNDVAMIDSQSLDLYMAPVDLNFLFTSIRSNLKADLVEREISFAIDGLSELPEVEGDTLALEKAFMQLVSNSIKYTPNEGTIGVNGRYHPPTATSEARIEIIVTDSGIGIAPELKELIFEKFYQTGDVRLHSSGATSFKGGGAGIGLAIAKGIVEAHQGTIWVESQGYDEETLPGSQFHVMLPVKQLSV